MITRGKKDNDEIKKFTAGILAVNKAVQKISSFFDILERHSEHPALYRYPGHILFFALFIKIIVQLDY